MPAQKTLTVTFTLGAGGLYQSEPTGYEFPVEPGSTLSVTGVVDGGSFTTAPTDVPLGTVQLWVAGGEGAAYPFVRLLQAETGLASLANLAAVGNTLVKGIANLEQVPGRRAKLVYARTSGGTASRMTWIITRSA